MSMPKVYENEEFMILGNDNKRKSAYILYNKRKEFSVGHTHLNNYRTAMWLMKLYLNRKVPLDLKSVYLLQSLIRISDDEEYTKRIQNIISIRKRKSHNYYINVQKGVKKRK